MRERRLGDIEVKPLQLTSNFRSQAKLVTDFNDIFDRIFPRPGDERDAGSDRADVPFVEAVPVREMSPRAGSGMALAVLAKGDSRQAHTEWEARTIRRIIEDRLAMPLPADRRDPSQPKPWRIAVLGRAKRHLAAVIEELKRDNGGGPIPYRAIDLDPLDELPEVLDALALTRALLHPSDRVAWLAVLHAPWCGLGISDLLALTGEGEEADARATIWHLVKTRRSSAFREWNETA